MALYCPCLSVDLAQLLSECPVQFANVFGHVLRSDVEMLPAQRSETPLGPTCGNDPREMLRVARVQRSLENVAEVDASEIRQQVLAVNSSATLSRHHRAAYIGRKAERNLGGKCCYDCFFLDW